MPPIPAEQLPSHGATEPLAYRIRDASRVSGLSKSYLYELAAEGRIKLSKIGGRTLIARTELLRLIDEGQQAA